MYTCGTGCNMHPTTTELDPWPLDGAKHEELIIRIDQTENYISETTSIPRLPL